MLVGFYGQTHLGRMLRTASEIRGFKTATEGYADCDLVFVTPDVEDHSKLDTVREHMAGACSLPDNIPVVLVSQVPPGFTRPWSKVRALVYYQVDTIIMTRALERAALPDRFIIGCEWPTVGMPGVYIDYLNAFNCPIIKMSYESAELSKLAVNYYLTRQIETANILDAVAKKVGADWQTMIPGLRLDKRIGEHAYIQPGHPNQHLLRDVKTIDELRWPLYAVPNVAS